MLLIMGLGTQMIGWPDEFCAQLAERGFQVVRFDNRDIGRSTKRQRAARRRLVSLITRKIDPVLYTLSDMAADAGGLMRELEIAPAHVVGASMGGMIAQTLAAQQPERVRSLVSIMSTTGNRWKGQPTLRHVPLSAAPGPGRARGVHRVHVAGVRGDRLARTALRPRAGPRHGRSQLRPRPRSRRPGRQLGAIIASGDRTAELRTIRVPTLVIHGSKDRMVARSGGVATARAIPGGAADDRGRHGARPARGGLAPAGRGDRRPRPRRRSVTATGAPLAAS